MKYLNTWKYVNILLDENVIFSGVVRQLIDVSFTGPCSLILLFCSLLAQAPAQPLSKLLSWGALSSHLHPRLYFGRPKGWIASPTHWTRTWQTWGDSEGQGGLACFSPWGHKGSDTTERLNWTYLQYMSSVHRKTWSLYFEILTSMKSSLQLLGLFCCVIKFSLYCL